MRDQAPGVRTLLRMTHAPGRSMRERLAAGDRSFSFEFFPPKDEAGAAVLWQAITELEPYRPTFVSVTYGAGGGTRDLTVAITERIAQETSLVPVAHLTCVGHTVEELADILRARTDILEFRISPSGD